MQKSFNIKTKKREEIIDVTQQVKRIFGDAVKEARVNDGLCVVYVPHATAAVIINENYDKAVREDIIDALRKYIPKGIWKHDKIDGNGDAHIKSSIIGPSEIIPIQNGKLELGTWQGIGLVELDGPRQREVIVKIIKS